MRTEGLGSRFTNEYSFAYFGEGLRALQKYHFSQQIVDIALATAVFEKATVEFPGDRIHYYYLGLIRLEQASLLPDSQQEPSEQWKDPLSLCINDAVSCFEHYQRDRADRGLDARRFYWADYNRAASYVHRLHWQSYLYARSILVPYLFDPPRLPCSVPSRRNPIHVTSRTQSGIDLIQYANFENDLVGSVHEWLSTGIESVTSKFISFASSGLREAIRRKSSRRRAQLFTTADSILFLLSVESLYLLTRVRPLREPLSLLHRSELGLEPIDEVEKAIAKLAGEMNEHLTTRPSRDKLSDESRSSLESDLQNHRGHLECAKALALASADDLSSCEQSNDNNAFVEIMSKLRGGPLLQKVTKHLSLAVSCFLESLSVQPGWIPAIKNLRTAYLALGDQGSASALALPTWPWPQNAGDFIKQSETDEARTAT